MAEESVDAAAVAAAAAATELEEPIPGSGGGSLPPRKRHTFIKPNGGAGGVNTGGGGGSPGKSPGAENVKQEEGCVRCGSTETSAWRRVKKSGVYQRLCNACTMLYSMNMFCPYCLVVYQDSGTNLGDPTVWYNCVACHRSVHIECEVKSLGSGNTAGSTVVTPPDAESYLCPECRKDGKENGKDKGDEEADVEGDGSPSGKRQKVEVKVEPTTTTMTTPTTTSTTPTGTMLPPSGKPSGAHEALAAAKNAALVAAKNAATAKATAIAKAQAAAKAALAARAALEFATQAARAEGEARTELRRNGVRMDPRAAGYLLPAPKKKEEESPMEDDDELARQMHHAMNSSPRTRTTPRRKAEIGSPVGAEKGAEVKEEPLFHPEDQQPQQQQAEVGGGVDTQGFSSAFMLAPESSSDANNAFFGDILVGFPSHEMQPEGMEVVDAGVPGGEPQVDTTVAAGGGTEDGGTNVELGVSIAEGLAAAAGILPSGKPAEASANLVEERMVVTKPSETEAILEVTMTKAETEGDTMVVVTEQQEVTTDGTAPATTEEAAAPGEEQQGPVDVDGGVMDFSLLDHMENAEGTAVTVVQEEVQPSEEVPPPPLPAEVDAGGETAAQ